MPEISLVGLREMSTVNGGGTIFRGYRDDVASLVMMHGERGADYLIAPLRPNANEYIIARRDGLGNALEGGASLNTVLQANGVQTAPVTNVQKELKDSYFPEDATRKLSNARIPPDAVPYHGEIDPDAHKTLAAKREAFLKGIAPAVRADLERAGIYSDDMVKKYLTSGDLDAIGHMRREQIEKALRTNDVSPTSVKENLEKGQGFTDLMQERQINPVKREELSYGEGQKEAAHTKTQPATLETPKEMSPTNPGRFSGLRNRFPLIGKIPLAGSLIAAAMAIGRGADAKEIAGAAIEAVPGVAAATALAQGRVKEAGARLAGDVTLGLGEEALKASFPNSGMDLATFNNNPNYARGN